MLTLRVDFQYRQPMRCPQSLYFRPLNGLTNRQPSTVSGITSGAAKSNERKGIRLEHDLAMTYHMYNIAHQGPVVNTQVPFSGTAAIFDTTHRGHRGSFVPGDRDCHGVPS